MSFSFAKVLPDLMTLARAALPMVGQGSSEAVTIGATVVKLIDTFTKEAPSDAPVEELKAKRDEIEKQVKLHAGRTVQTLKGGTAG